MILLQAEPTAIDYDFWQLVVRIVQAIGTISVALLAIFGARIINLIFKPNLMFEISGKKPFIETIQERQDMFGSQNRHIRISSKVSNKGNTTAKNSQAIVEKVFSKRKANDTFYLDQEFIPTRFEWNNEEESSIVTPQIPSFVRIARIEEETVLTSNESSESDNNAKNEFELYLEIQDPNESGSYLKLGKGTFIIPIVLYCDNLRNTTKVFIEIYWNGSQINNLSESVFYIKELNYSQIPNIVKQ